jgi:glycine cleavage system H protein
LVTAVDLPKEGDQVTKGQKFGVIESVKSVSDLYAPVSGQVVGITAALKDSPEDVNSDPYGKGWMIDIEPNDKSEIDELMDVSAYQTHVSAQ